MQFSELLFDGINLMLIGMGTVFLFLSVLVVSVIGMSKLAFRLAPMKQKAQSERLGPTEKMPPEHIAVISAAVRRYRAAQLR